MGPGRKVERYRWALESYGQYTHSPRQEGDLVSARSSPDPPASLTAGNGFRVRSMGMWAWALRGCICRGGVLLCTQRVSTGVQGVCRSLRLRGGILAHW